MGGKVTPKPPDASVISYNHDLSNFKLLGTTWHYPPPPPPPPVHTKDTRINAWFALFSPFPPYFFLFFPLFFSSFPPPPPPFPLFFPLFLPFSPSTPFFLSFKLFFKLFYLHLNHAHSHGGGKKKKKKKKNLFSSSAARLSVSVCARFRLIAVIVGFL